MSVCPGFPEAALALTHLISNYLDVRPADRRRFIYRIIPTFRLIELLKMKENVLSKPKKWDDPFENFILRSHLIREGTRVSIGLRDCFYGQCWTLQSVSDAM